jgi:hypothetical protein
MNRLLIAHSKKSSPTIDWADIRDYGASQSVTPYENTEAIKLALAASDYVKFGDYGQIYEVSQPIRVNNNHNFKIESELKIMDVEYSKRTSPRFGCLRFNR